MIQVSGDAAAVEIVQTDRRTNRQTKHVSAEKQHVSHSHVHIHVHANPLINAAVLLAPKASGGHLHVGACALQQLKKPTAAAKRLGELCENGPPGDEAKRSRRTKFIGVRLCRVAGEQSLPLQPSRSPLPRRKDIDNPHK